MPAIKSGRFLTPFLWWGSVKSGCSFHLPTTKIPVSVSLFPLKVVHKINDTYPGEFSSFGYFFEAELA